MLFSSYNRLNCEDRPAGDVLYHLEVGASTNVEVDTVSLSFTEQSKSREQNFQIVFSPSLTSLMIVTIYRPFTQKIAISHSETESC